jgi:hypothetical protein
LQGIEEITSQNKKTMNLIVKTLIFIGISLNIPVFAQQKHDQFSNKFLLKKDTLFAVKKPADKKKVANLFFISTKNGKIGWNSTHSGKLYPNYAWDIDDKYWVGERNNKYGVQYEQHSRAITFLAKNEWLVENEFDTIAQYVRNKTLAKNRLSAKEKNYLNFQVFIPSTHKHVVSERFNGISSFYTRRMVARFPPPIRYDWAMLSDHSFLMPILFEDTLHLYRFTNTAWHSPNYQGIEANRANDKWTKEKSIPVEKRFDDQFRYFSIQDESYFVANADTSLYKLDGQQMRKIGTIKKESNQDLNYLLDKDTHKLYFIHALSLDIAEEERERFAILRPGDPLYIAVQKLLAAKEKRKLHKSGE